MAVAFGSGEIELREKINRELTRHKLSPFKHLKPDDVYCAFGPMRMQEYGGVNYNLGLVYRFGINDLKGSRHLSVTSNLIGLEFNVFLREILLKGGVRPNRIWIEQDIRNNPQNGKIDLVAQLLGDENISFDQVFFENGEAKTRRVKLKQGIHIFECKVVQRLFEDVVPQLNSARGYYLDPSASFRLVRDANSRRNTKLKIIRELRASRQSDMYSHVMVSRETVVEEGIHGMVQSADSDILVGQIERNGLKQRLDSVRVTLAMLDIARGQETMGAIN